MVTQDRALLHSPDNRIKRRLRLELVGTEIHDPLAPMVGNVNTPSKRDSRQRGMTPEEASEQAKLDRALSVRHRAEVVTVASTQALCRTESGNEDA